MLSWTYLVIVASLLAVNADLIPFDDWNFQRVALKDVNLAFRYAGTGPPILLVHGYPQHSLTWHTIGPILAQTYTVIAPDNRGMGQSTIPPVTNYDFTAQNTSEDLKGILDFLNITSTYVVSHDKGSGIAAALSATYPSLVKRVVFSEYPLPGFGYETATPTEFGPMGLYQNWQLSFFSVPDAAQYFIQGREREMLSWYFFHASYSGTEAITLDHLQRYTDQISKPGFLRSGLEYFANVAQEAQWFNATLRPNPLNMPVLALGGESSFAPVSALQSAWGPTSRDIEYDIVPKAGHWVADENPVWVANRVQRFLAKDSGIPSVDLAYLDDKVTLV